MIRYPCLVNMLLASAVILAACSARRGEPLYGPLPIRSAEVTNGRQVFMRDCHQCHPGGEAGLGPAINNKPLPGFLMAFQVRQGFGAMPAFSEDEISSQELDHLILYLKEIRKHPQGG